MDRVPSSRLLGVSPDPYCGGQEGWPGGTLFSRAWTSQACERQCVTKIPGFYLIPGLLQTPRVTCQVIFSVGALAPSLSTRKLVPGDLEVSVHLCFMGWVPNTQRSWGVRTALRNISQE